MGRQALLADQVGIKLACLFQLNLQHLYMPCMVLGLFLYAYKDSRWFLDGAVCFYMISASSEEAVA